jgi:hypothetical protein
MLNKLKIRYFRTTPQQADEGIRPKIFVQSDKITNFLGTYALSGLQRKPAMQAVGEFF